jgi:hypothetical protein
MTRTAIAVLLPLLCLTPTILAQGVTDNMRAMIEKSQSFGLGKYPISFWNYTHLTAHGQHMTQAEVEMWADAGFTVPQSSNFDPKKPEQVAHMRRILDWAHERGMRLIVCDPRCYAKRSPEGKLIPDDYAAGVQAAVELFGDHPALFGFHVGDEPEADRKLAFFESYRVQKQIAPHLHPFANLFPWYLGVEPRAGTDTWPNYLDEFVTKSTADLICYDCYAQMKPGFEGWDTYYKNLRLYREAALRNGIPFWNTILCTGHWRYRCPNYDEMRWQFNTTLASGAHGILWFFYYMREPRSNYRLAPIDEHWDKTQLYDEIRRLQKGFHRRYGDLFTHLASTRVSFYPEPFGDGEVFSPNETVSRIHAGDKDPLLLGEFVDLQGRKYVMLVNNSMTEPFRVGITFPGASTKVYSWDWDGQEYEGGAYSVNATERDETGLTIYHWLAPGQEAMYRVETAGTAGDRE